VRKVKDKLAQAGYDGSLLRANDLLLALDKDEVITTDEYGEPDVIICNLEIIWKTGEKAR